MYDRCQASRVNSDSQQAAADVRETLEYKKAMELQLWMEEQKALYKAQVVMSRTTRLHR